MSTRPATIVGSANGRSISEFTTFLPGKSSRTSTQAISVPATALIAATATAAMSVTRSASSAIGFVTASQNPDQPSSVERTTSAAIGMRTRTVR